MLSKNAMSQLGGSGFLKLQAAKGFKGSGQIHYEPKKSVELPLYDSRNMSG